MSNKPTNLKEWMQRVESGYVAEFAPPSVPGKPNATVVPGVGTITFPIAPGQSMQQGTARAKELGAAVQAGQAVVTTTDSSGKAVVGQSQKPGSTTTGTGAVAGMTNATATAVKEDDIQEVAAPGQEEWIKSNKARFIDQYGKEKGLGVLYATAWKRSKADKKQVKEGIESMQPMDEGKVALALLLRNYPHEHRMAQEGWGIDEGFYNALCDHYHHSGRIPRDMWHGPVSALRGHIEECYMQDTVNDPDEHAMITHGGPHGMGEGIVGDVGAEIGSTLGGVAGSRFGTPGMAVGSVIGAKLGGSAGNAIDTNIVEPLIGEEDLEEGVGDDLKNRWLNWMSQPSGASSMVKNQDRATIENTAKKFLAAKGYEGDISSAANELINALASSDIQEAGWKKAAAIGLTGAALLGGGIKAGEYVGRKGNEMVNKMIQQGGDTRGAAVKNVELTPPEGQNLPMPAQTPRKKLYKGDIDESSLESRLRAATNDTTEELTMESKKIGKMAEGEVKMTKTGIKHKGHYGKHFDTDEEGEEKVAAKSEPVKRGRGRPKKAGSESDTKDKGYSSGSELNKFMSGKGKSEAPNGKKSKKVKESMLQTSIRTARAESPRDAEINNLAKRFLSANDSEKKLIKNSLVRLGVTDSEFNQRVEAAKHFKGATMPSSIKKDIQMESWENQLRSLLEADDPFAKFDDGEADVPVLAMPRGMGMSQNPEEDEADKQITIVAVGSDEVLDHLDGEDNDPMSPDDGGSTLDFIKRMMGARVGEKIGDVAKEEKAHGHEGHDHSEKVAESVMCESCECDPCECDDEDKLDEGAKPDYIDLDKDGNKKESMKKAAKDAEEVKEGEGETCNECGAMMEDDHMCSTEKLDEWANTSQGKSHEQFITDIDFMTKVISGGLNNMKQDQTTLPSTRVRTQSEQFSPATSLAELMRKLGNIK